MWWKFYLAIIFINALIFDIRVVLGLFHGAVFGLYFYLSIVSVYLGIFGLYCYVFNKKSFSKDFWKYFFWVSLVLNILPLIYSLLPKNIQKLLFLDFGSIALEDIFLTIVLFTPQFYAVYKISKGEYRKMDKKVNSTKKSLKY